MEGSRVITALGEKHSVAFTSLIVAVVITTLEAIAGILTNSLGIISGALQSALDIVAAGATVYAVRKSSEPPDEDHLYGHGKYESFTALVETLLLLATCVWVTYEAFQRLFFRQAHVEASLAGFAVMTISIVLDTSRFRSLRKVARKYHDQALEADALHFASDALGSAVVVLGLLFLWLGYPIADPLAALGVVAIIAGFGLQLGRRTVFVLLDRAPAGMAGAIKGAVSRIPGVQSCGRVRVRPSGMQTFVDVEVFVDRSTSFERADAIATEVERAIRKLVPSSDIVVETRPMATREPRLADRIRQLGSRIDGVRGLHSIAVHDADDGLHVDMHLETDPDASLETAHQIASELEAGIKKDIPQVAEVVTHIESAGEMPRASADITLESHRIVSAVRETALGVSGVRSCGDVTVHRAEDGFHLTVTCTLYPGLFVSDAHDISTRIEETLRTRIHGTSRVMVHVEPGSKAVPA